LDDFAQTAILFAYFNAEGQIPAAGTNGSGLSASGFSASAFIMAMRVFAVYEYNETNGQPGFQPNSDVATGWYDLSNPFLAWNAITATKQTMTDPTTGGTFDYHSVTIQTTDNVFRLTFHCATVPVQIGSVVITPDNVKIDIEIKWFNNPDNTASILAPWRTGPSNVAQARVGVVVLTAAAAESVNVANTPGVGGTGATNKVTYGGTGGAAGGFFSWNDTADSVVASGAGGAGVLAVEFDNATFSASVNAAWTVKLFTFSFDAIRPSDVTWDPVLGGDKSYTVSGAVGMVASVAVSLFSVLFAVMLMETSRRL